MDAYILCYISPSHRTFFLLTAIALVSLSLLIPLALALALAPVLVFALVLPLSPDFHGYTFSLVPPNSPPTKKNEFLRSPPPLLVGRARPRFRGDQTVGVGGCFWDVSGR